MKEIKAFQTKTFSPLKLFFLNNNYGGVGKFSHFNIILVLYFNLKCQHYYQVLRDCKPEIFKRNACALIYL